MSWVLVLDIRVSTQPFDSGKGSSISKAIIFNQLGKGRVCQHHGKMAGTAKDLQGELCSPKPYELA
jgi:hypothetical protein